MNDTESDIEEIIWSRDVEELFLKIISHANKMVRGLAKRAVSKKAKENAIKRQSKEVSRMDLIRANLSETPGPFRKSMFNALDVEGITEEEIRIAEDFNSKK